MWVVSINLAVSHKQERSNGDASGAIIGGFEVGGGCLRELAEDLWGL